MFITYNQNVGLRGKFTVENIFFFVEIQVLKLRKLKWHFTSSNNIFHINIFITITENALNLVENIYRKYNNY